MKKIVHAKIFSFYFLLNKKPTYIPRHDFTLETELSFSVLIFVVQFNN